MPQAIIINAWTLIKEEVFHPPQLAEQRESIGPKFRRCETNRPQLRQFPEVSQPSRRAARFVKVDGTQMGQPGQDAWRWEATGRARESQLNSLPRKRNNVAGPCLVLGTRVVMMPKIYRTAGVEAN
jgi:hypothetical protein